MDSTGIERRKFPLWLFIFQIIFIIVYIKNIPILRGWYVFSFSRQIYLLPLINGISFYMVYRGGYTRLFGIAGLIIPIPLAYFLLYVTRDPAFFVEAETVLPRAVAVWATVIDLIGKILRLGITPIAMIAIAIAAARRRNNGPSFTVFVFLAALASMIEPHLLRWMAGDFSALMDNSAVSSLILALAIIPSALLVKAIDERKGWERSSPPIWARLWYGLLFLATIMIFSSSIVNEQTEMRWFILGIPAAIGSIGLFMLLFGLQSGFHLYVISIISSIAIIFLIHPIPIRQPTSYSTYHVTSWSTHMIPFDMPMPWGLLCTVALSFIITWGLTRYATFNPVEKPQQGSRPIHEIIPIIETITALFCVFLAYAGWHIHHVLSFKPMAILFLFSLMSFDPIAGTALAVLQGAAAVLGSQQRGPIAFHAFCLFVAAMVWSFMIVAIHSFIIRY